MPCDCPVCLDLEQRGGLRRAGATPAQIDPSATVSRARQNPSNGPHAAPPPAQASPLEEAHRSLGGVCAASALRRLAVGGLVITTLMMLSWAWPIAQIVMEKMTDD